MIGRCTGEKMAMGEGEEKKSVIDIPEREN